MLNKRNTMWKEGGVRICQRGGGITKIPQTYKALGMTKWGVGPSTSSYGERGGRIGAEGTRDRRKKEPKTLSKRRGKKDKERACVLNEESIGARITFAP